MKSKRKKLIEKLDRIFSQYIRLRDKGCVICGSRQNLQNGHYITRSAWATRWDEINCNCQCEYHNNLHETSISAYKNWFILKYGQSVLQEITYKSNQIRKYTLQELEELVIKYKTLVERMMHE
jgi:hypothetical protein